MRLQMSAWLLLLACWGAPRGAEAYGYGAPPETCVSMTPGHGAAVASLGYSIDVSGTNFTNTSNLTATTTVVTVLVNEWVTVKGTYEGVIMQARAPGSTTPVGTWATPPADTKVMQCSSASDTMTHSSETNKANSVFTWISPKNGAPASVEFVATVAQNKDQWIKNIKSKAVTAQGYVATTKSPATSTAKPGNSAGRSALAMSGLSLGALLVVVTAACCR